jgi:carboxymethylenebutenolidase
MAGSYIDVTARDGGRFRAYLAVPEKGSGPGIVLLQEIFGVNQHMRDVADLYAEEGYVVLAPDLFWRIEPGVELGQSEADWQRAFGLYEKFNLQKGMQDVAATVAALRGLPQMKGKVGALGFCLGGKLAYLMATRTDVDASVGYYGVGIENDLGEAGNIKKPLLLHVAEKDKFVPPEAQKKVRETLERNPQVTIYNYPNCDHAFARVGGEHYDKEAADTANRRTLDFFNMNLKV